MAEQEVAIASAFRRYIAAVGSDGAVLDAIIERLERGDFDGAMQIVDSYVVTFGNVLPQISASVGVATAAELGEILSDSVMAISFDPSHPRAAEIIRANRLRFVQDFSTHQREAALQALQRGYLEGQGTQQIARSFRQSIGLTAEQERWVSSYRAQLEARDRRALDRALRDRRHDGTVARAIARDRPLTPKQIDTMVDRYRGGLLIMRSETISRTEGTRATSQAREESLDQMIEQTGIPVDQIERIWNTTRDKRRRDWHATMDNQRRARNERFRDGHGSLLMYPGDPAAPAETTINCRCGLTFSIKPTA